jgi:hypothetical protein
MPQRPGSPLHPGAGAGRVWRRACKPYRSQHLNFLHSPTSNEEIGMPHQREINPELNQCIEACLDCYRSCQQDALTHCLQMGGRHTEPEHFRLMLDCAESCRSTAALMLNNSPYHHELCGLCATICDDCAESCRALGDMDDCAQVCERCAESCRQMAGAGRGGRGQAREARPTQ